MPDRLTPTPDQLIEDALRSHPISPMPRSITTDVMARIQATPAPRFHFTRNDTILTLVLTIVFSSIVFSLQFLPDHILLQLRIQWILIWQSLLVNARWLVPALFFGLAGVLAALTLPSLYRMTMGQRR
jgi:hypothetical protein